MKTLFENTLTKTMNGAKVTIKLIIILGLTIILLIPQNLINDLVRERLYRQQDIERNISAQIGGYEDVTGPILCIPFTVDIETTKTDKNGNQLKEIEQITKTAFFSSEQLDIKSNVTVENKSKGIYKLPYFQSENILTANFAKPDFTKWEIEDEHVLYEKAFVIVGISDLKGVDSNPVLQLGGKSIEFEPGTKDVKWMNGIHANMPLDWQNDDLKVEINLSLRGTESLNFASTAKTNLLEMESNWPNPNFESTMNTNVVIETGTNSTVRGNSLPASYTIFEDNTGFTASWKESQFSISQPSQWLSTNNAPNLNERFMGTEFVNLTDHYSKSDRSVKYMVLIICFVFLAFFLIELIKGNKVHPFQYIMVGSAIAIFFVLLLALSEYLGFNLAYFIAATATVLLVGIYSKSVFKTSGLAIGVGSLLSALFVFIFVILIATQYSLIIGAIGLFVILALVMYVTRNIQWYEPENE